MIQLIDKEISIGIDRHTNSALKLQVSHFERNFRYVSAVLAQLMLR